MSLWRLCPRYTYMIEVAAVVLEGRGEPNRSEKGEKTETNELEALNGARTAAMLVRNNWRLQSGSEPAVQGRRAPPAVSWR